MLLQWPHQGAWNLIKTVLPAVCSSQFSGVSSMATAIDAKVASFAHILAIAMAPTNAQ